MHRLMPLLAAVYCLSYSHSSNASENELTVLQDPVDYESLDPGDYLSPNVFPQNPDNWTGCFTRSTDNSGDAYGTGSWGGTQGGPCPNIGEGGFQPGTIRFSYGERTLENVFAIDQAMKSIGIDVYGYTYEWYVKNYNSNDESTAQTQNQDPFEVEIIIRNASGDIFSKTYDYSQPIANWTKESGFEYFTDAVDLALADEIVLSVTAADAGYWAGYYGPEFAKYDVKFIFTVRQDCTDPLADPTCPGYGAALAEQQNELVEELFEDVTEENMFVEEETGQFFEEETTNVVQEENIVQNEQVYTEETIVEEIAETETLIVEETIQEIVEEETVLIEEEIQKEVNEVFEESIEEEIVQEEIEATENTESGPKIAPVNPLAVARQAVNQSANVASSAVSSTMDNTNASANQSISMNNEMSSQSGDVQSSNNTSIQMSGSNFGMETGISDENFISQMASSSAQLSIQMDEQVRDEIISFSNNMNLQNSLELENITSNIEMNIKAISENSMTEANTLSQQSVSNDISNFTGIDDLNLENNLLVVTIEMEPFELASLTPQAMFEVVNNTLNFSNNNEELEPQLSNEQEAELVEKAKSGSDDEDAKAALLGYNPDFKAYQTEQMPDTQFYEAKDIYPDQKNHDNPAGRFFNGASDDLHRKMVRQQYDQ